MSKADPVPAGAVGRALAEAQVYGDQATAERYGVAQATLPVWRHRMAEDAAVQEAYRAAAAELLSAWATHASRLYVEIVDRIRERIADEGVGVRELAALLRTVGEQLVQGQAIGNALASPAPITAPGARKGTRLQ